MFDSLLDPAVHIEKEWLKSIRSLAAKPGRLIDMGGGTPYQGYLRREDVGARTRYYSLDVFLPARPHVVADITKIPLSSNSVDAILCNAVLEHVHHPQQAVDEMWRVLVPGGRMLVAVPFIYPFHDRVDYYRFSRMALEVMFSKFIDLQITPLSDYHYATLLFVTGFQYRLAKILSPVLHLTRGIMRIVFMLKRAVSPSRVQRDYERSLRESPVGWYISCTKPASQTGPVPEGVDL